MGRIANDARPRNYPCARKAKPRIDGKHECGVGALERHGRCASPQMGLIMKYVYAILLALAMLALLSIESF